MKEDIYVVVEVCKVSPFKGVIISSDSPLRNVRTQLSHAVTHTAESYFVLLSQSSDVWHETFSDI